MPDIINGYRLKGELKNDKSGFAKWGFAEKDGIEVFVKEFLSPIYPLDETVLSMETIRKKREICAEFEYEKRCFYNELNKCSTGNIVTALDFFRNGSKYYMITEKIDAAPIAPEEICKLDTEQKILIIKIILHCMNSLHKHGIVHGDIKPDNILFKRTQAGAYTAKIIDFDSSFLETNPPKTDEDLQGDMVYFAPESFLFVAEEEGELTGKIDVFALGILFHQYFCGELPYYDREKYDYIFEAVLDGYELGISNTIPPDLRALIIKMLDREPGNRPGIGEVFTSITGKKADKDRDEVYTTSISSGGLKINFPSKPEVIEEKKAEPVSMNTYFRQADDLL